ncbi:MAG: NADH:flavin oxidoreductase [Hyphomicrobiaceae bacterium]
MQITPTRLCRLRSALKAPSPVPSPITTVLSPLVTRNLTLKNRLLRSSISGRFDLEDGTPTPTRANWEAMFAEGGVGAIITSYVPVLMSGRIIAGYATIHEDRLIAPWQRIARRVHDHGCKIIMQLSLVTARWTCRACGRSASRRSHPPTLRKPARLSDARHDHWRDPAWCRPLPRPPAVRAKQAWMAYELHAANGYLFTQFLSSGINDRTDRYGGSLFNRARFLLDVIHAIRAEVGSGYHLQVKLSAVDLNDVIPTEGRGNTLDETIEVARWVEAAGADALHVSIGSLFPHPLNPPGDFAFNTIASTYDAMLSSGEYTFRNYLFFRYPPLRGLFARFWGRMQKGRPVEGVSADETIAIKRAVTIPVISTGVAKSPPDRSPHRRRRFRCGSDRPRPDCQSGSGTALDQRSGSAARTMYALQQVPHERAQEPAGLLRTGSLRRRQSPHGRRILAIYHADAPRAGP